MRYVLLYHFVGHSFFGLIAFRSFSNIIKWNFSLTLAKLNFYVDMSVWLFVGKQYNRFHMCAAGEEVEGFGGLEGVAGGGEELQVPGQRGRVAGDVDHALRRHGPDRLDDVGADALARRVDDDDVGPGVPVRQHFRGLTGVHAEKLSVFHAVLRSVEFRILDRLRDDLHADGLFCMPGQTERDRARAAVQVEDGLVPGQTSQLHGLFVQPLRLRVVDLIKRRGGQEELQPAERIGDGPIAIKRMEFRAEDGIAFFGVGGKYDRRDAGLGGKQGRDELLFLRQLRAVGDDADEDLPAFRAEADIDVADIAGVRLLVIGADVILLHPG